MGLVYMTKDGVGTLGGPVPEKSFERLWKPKGWVKATAEQVAKHELNRNLRLSDDKTALVSAGDKTSLKSEATEVDPAKATEVDPAKAADPSVKADQAKR